MVQSAAGVWWAQAASSSASIWSLAVPYLLVFVIFYLIWWRPVRQRQKRVEEQLAKLTKGDRVITNGGFYGKVVKAEGDVVVLEIADGVRTRIARRSISGLEETSTENGSKTS